VKKLKEDGRLEEYRKTLKYRKIFMVQPDIIVEQFVEGEFVKYLNNTGDCLKGNYVRPE
jgi:hypothetical protein